MQKDGLTINKYFRLIQVMVVILSKPLLNQQKIITARLLEKNTFDHSYSYQPPIDT